ncbi:MAG: porin [Hyphomicrobiaceae bacterium]|nr:porin [Hyphomicrobiaceae bacterium]
MIGGLLKTTSLVALVAAAGMFSVSAQAADLGGDCCADLEERVAELEATTARKGNRKVSLQIYGQVTTAVMWFDAQRTDGGVSLRDEQNVYVVDPQTSGTRFGFKGDAKIDADWSAGFNIELQYQQADATLVTLDSDEGPDIPEFRQAYWYLKSKTLGRIAVGQTDTANSSIAEIDVSKAIIADSMSSSAAGAAIISGNLSGPGQSNYEFNRMNVVRYDSPTFAGFVATAAYGEDDIWDIALRYAGEFGGFKLAAGIAYGESTDSSNGAAGTDDPAFEIINGSVSVMHVSTGLFVTASGGQRERDSYVGEDTFYHVVAGIEQKWMPLGATTIFGMGGEQDEKDSDFGNVDGDRFEFYGGGIVQQIDAAAMELFLSYRHYDITDGGDAELDDESEFDVVVGGARIKF